MLSLMERQTGRAEGSSARCTLLGMGKAEGSSTVVAQCFCGAATGCPYDSLHTSYLDYSAKEIVHIVKRTFEQRG